MGYRQLGRQERIGLPACGQSRCSTCRSWGSWGSSDTAVSAVFYSRDRLDSDLETEIPQIGGSVAALTYDRKRLLLAANVIHKYLW